MGEGEKTGSLALRERAGVRVPAGINQPETDDKEVVRLNVAVGTTQPSSDYSAGRTDRWGVERVFIESPNTVFSNVWTMVQLRS
jgi:hypothetical protein